MRISTAGQTRAHIARLMDSQRRLAEAQQRATSGLRVERVSDDPTSGGAIMGAAAGARGVAQYERNVDRVADALAAEDVVLQQVGDLMSRARELGVMGASSNTDAGGRRAAAAEVRQLVRQATALGNTRVGDDYLFGGANNDGRAPFVEGGAPFVVTDPGPPVAPRYPEGTREVEAGPGGQRLAGAHDGTSVFLARAAGGAPDPSAGVLGTLTALADALDADDQEGVQAALAPLDAAAGALQTRVGELGARQNHADAVRAGLAALGATLAERKGALSEVDMERAITEMLARQTAYQAAMLASSKVMGMSLADYLR